MKPEDCGKYPTCPKIGSLADRDMTDFQFADGVRKVCGECEGGIYFNVPLEALAEDRSFKLCLFLMALKELRERIDEETHRLLL